MIIKRPDIKIGIDNFDDRDWLDRKQVAHKLSELVDSFDSPLVIALDGNWGSGKSHFLKLWVREHEDWIKSRHTDLGTPAPLTIVVYFDAFEHDYLNDPLTSLVIKLERSIGGDSPNIVGEFKKASVKLSLPILQSIASYFSGGSLDKLFKSIEEMRGAIWSVETERIQAMIEFRVALEELAEKHKLIFIIDELDRCRPDYALKTLETIKHFFQVQNVHFVFGANFSALESSVESTYGSNIGAEKYLKKFISLFIRFNPRPERSADIGVYFDQLIAHASNSTKIDNQILEAAYLFLKCKIAKDSLSLRDVEHLLSRISLFSKDVSHLPGAQKYLIALISVLEAIDQNNIAKLDTGTLDSTMLDGFLSAPNQLTQAENQTVATSVTLCKYLNNPNIRLEPGFPSDHMTRITGPLDNNTLEKYKAQTLYYFKLFEFRQASK